MEYIKVKWIHSHSDEPILLYSEIDMNKMEARKVEVFKDGGIGFACSTEATFSPKTILSIEPLPSLQEIASDPQFDVARISKDEFEAIWAKRSSSARVP